MIAKNTAFGNATEHLVEKFYNLYDIEDDGLEFNKKFEKYNSLGLVGASSEMDVPENYNETNVAYEIPPISDANGDGNVEECSEKNKPVHLFVETIIVDKLVLENLFSLHWLTMVLWMY